MAILIRIILLILPVIALLLFVRHRLRSHDEPEILAAEVVKLRRQLIALVAAIFAAGVGLYFVSDKGAPGSCFIAPYTKDGKVVPSQYVAEDDPRCIAARTRKTPDVGSSPE